MSDEPERRKGGHDDDDNTSHRSHPLRNQGDAPMMESDHNLYPTRYFPPEQYPTTDRALVAWVTTRILNILGHHTRYFTAFHAIGALFQTKIGLANRRMMAIFDRINAGQPAPKKAKPRPGRTSKPKPKPALRLPTKIGWLDRIYAWQHSPMPDLRRFLASESTLLAMLAQQPSFGRVLRGYCRLIGEPIPACLQLPKRARKPRPPKPPQPKVIIPKGVRYRRPKLPPLPPLPPEQPQPAPESPKPLRSFKIPNIMAR